MLLEAGWSDMVHEIWTIIVPEEEVGTGFSSCDSSCFAVGSPVTMEKFLPSP